MHGKAHKAPLQGCGDEGQAVGGGPSGQGGAQAHSNILPHHLAQLQASAIAREVIEARGYRSATTRAGLKRLGFSEAQARAPALVIPLWGVAGEVVGCQARPDWPRVVDGKAVKYETPRGSRAVLDAHPFARVRLGDPLRPPVCDGGDEVG
jgi:hypothetical protein